MRSFMSDGCAEGEAPEFVTSPVTVTGGTYKSEVRWSISCNGTQYVSEDTGRAPYDSTV